MSNPDTERPSILDQLPGELMMWVLIVSEFVVFGAGLAAFLLSPPAAYITGTVLPIDGGLTAHLGVHR